MSEWKMPDYYERELLYNNKLAMFYWQQSEKYLKDVVESSTRITNRYYSLLTIVLGITSLTTGISIGHAGDFAGYTAMFATLLFVVVLLMILIQVKSRMTVSLGYKPQEFLVEFAYDEYKKPSDDMYSNTIVKTINTHAEWIAKQEKRNKERCEMFDTIVTIFTASLILITLVVLIYTIF